MYAIRVRAAGLARLLAPVAVAAFLLAAPAAADADGDAFEAALATAAEQGKPVLVDLYATWCGPCKRFKRDSAADARLSEALAEHVVLVAVDAEKGDGINLAYRYDVNSFPTFVLADAEGKTIDRWLGYGGPNWFIDKLTNATSDLRTLSEKRAAFIESPTEALARKLGDVAYALDRQGDAIRYYERAMALEPAPDVSYAARIFNAMSRGKRTGLFTDDDLVAKADDVLASKHTSGEELVEVAFTMHTHARKSGDIASYLPYLDAARTAIRGAPDGELDYAKNAFAIHGALYVDHDVTKAVELKKSTLAEGWMDDADELNSFAWWCFENEVNLDEAEALARKGVELAEPGREKANVLDTLAEICNLKGDCGQAVELMRQAVAVDPKNGYLKRQLARFEELLAKQS